MVLERSPRVPKCTEGGNWAWKLGIRFRTVSATSIVFAPGCFCTCNVTARSAVVAVYTQEEFSSFSTLSTTLATSFNRIGDPLRQDTTMLPNATALNISPLVLRLNACLGPDSVPVGEFVFQAEMAAETSLMPIFLATSLSGSSCTRTAYLAAPCTCTCETPLSMAMRGAIMFSAKSSSSASGSVCDVRYSWKIG